MSRHLPLSEVEARIRTTLRVRSEDCADPSSNGSSNGDRATSWEPPAGRPVLDLVEPRPPRRPRVMAAAAVAAVLVAGGVAVRVATASGGGDHGGGTVAAGPDEADADGAAHAGPGAGDSDSTAAAAAVACGDELPVDVTVPMATEGPIAGPAPGGDPARPGQVVVHWAHADGSVEARWPADPKPVYDLDGDAGDAGGDGPGGWVVETITAPEPRAELHLEPAGGVLRYGTPPDVVIEGSTSQEPPCDTMQLILGTDEGRVPYGLGLRPDPTAPDSHFGTVDLAPLIVERRDVDEAPDHVIPCSGPRGDGRNAPPNRRGGPDETVRGDEPSDVLQAYLARRAGAITSGYVEMLEPDGSVTYGVDPHGEGWTTLVGVSEDDTGWYLDGWEATGC